MTRRRPLPLGLLLVGFFLCAWILTWGAALVRAQEPVAEKASAGEKLFREAIAPIFERRCITCHRGDKPKGGLSLESGELATKGGESGPAIVPGDPNSSYLLDLIAPTKGKAEMPKEADPLTEKEREAIQKWIASGAAWPKGLILKERNVLTVDWWSLRPLHRPNVPMIQDPNAIVRNPIDAFVLAKLKEKGLTPSPEADRRTLIRRLSFDLLGMPPTSDEVESFMADNDPQAYEKLVDRYLNSPRHGERWARHWLDVVHYGETHGYDKDKPRPNAWPYRDYVIRSLNDDKPYSRFVQEQLAGDVLFPESPEGIEALGFIAAGPWDFIGHAEVPESKIDGMVARHLDRDDMVINTMETFMSLTVGCAQCHNHKFDPITQQDYYSLQAVFAAVDRADKFYYRDPALTRTRSELVARQQGFSTRRDAVKARIASLAGPELAELDLKIAAGEKSSVQAPPEHGYHSAIEPAPDRVKWVQIDLGGSKAISKLLYSACYDDFNNIGAGFGFPVRFKIELADDPEFKTGVRIAVDQTQADFPNPKSVQQKVDLKGVKARYVRFTAVKLAPRSNDYILALAELSVLDEQGKNLAQGSEVTSLDSIEAPIRWSRKNLVDGIFPQAAVSAEEQKALLAQREALLERKVERAIRDELAHVTLELDKVDAELKKLPPPQVVYAGTVHNGSGAFRGTGPDGGKPRAIRVLHRGSVLNPLEETGAGALSCLSPLPGRFSISADRPEGERRAALAKWLTDAKNPLTWRSIVNRVWLYHFGSGIVDTPNDFGRMGQLPTHPELLDWLAAEFRDEGQSLKKLHRLIVTSATYRQSSAVDPQRQQKDAGNIYYWKMNRRRLEAEAIRDSLLAVSGKLDLTMHGPSFQDFVIEKPEHSPHYEYHLHNPEDPKSHRRTIYRFIVRSQQQPYMTVLDCADPSMLVGKRNQTITPLQALAQLNNQMSVVLAKHFAARVSKGGKPLREQVAEAFRIALARAPAQDELQALTKYAEKHGLAGTCRVIMNLNEFVFVD